MNTSHFCSVLSLEAGESLAGTADRVDVWLMLEYRGAWRAQVVTDNDLDASTREWLDQVQAGYRARGLSVRLQMIRQPQAGDLRLLTVQGSGVVVRSAPHYAGLAEAPEREDSRVHYFVCTHGQRDRCCSEFGMPVYRVLRDRLGDRVWQTSHLGGHRFAANVLVAPDAAMYGRVTPGDIEAFLAATEHGRLFRPLARGRTCLSPEVQAAEILGAMNSAPEQSEQLGENRWRVRFREGSVSVESREIASLASCGDSQPRTARMFTLSM